MVALQDIQRHKTKPVKVGQVTIGGNAPIIIQSMTNTDTEDIISTVNQVKELYNAGSEIIRITVNTDDAAKAVPHIQELLLKDGVNVPLVGCFHYNGHKLLIDYPDCAKALAKYRINPGNVGFGSKRDDQFSMMIETALKYDKPVRIGVNWGSLDQKMLAKLMDENKQSGSLQSADEIMREALVQSAINSATQAEDIGLAKNKIILSAKVSRVQDLIVVYRALAERSNYALHLGLTEAGMGRKGITASTAAMSVLLQDGIGDTIRVSLTPRLGESRTEEVMVCQDLLQSMGMRFFAPQISACPGCGRTTSTYFQELAGDIEDYIRQNMPEWKTLYSGVESLNIAVMGCIVNGPGESKHADIGISLPGSGEAPIAPVFIDGKKAHTLRGETISKDFQAILLDYIVQRFGRETLEIHSKGY